jgi:hypothetical protein
MKSIHGLTRKLNLAALGFVFVLPILLVTSCAYRFSNLHVKSPNKIETIAFESVFDSGGEVVPHELLWDELQRAFAANGHLKVSSLKSADALLRAHIRSATTGKAGNRNTHSGTLKDPPLYDVKSDPRKPGELRDLSTARDYFTKSSTSFVVDVEVWDIKTRALILQRTYGGAFEAQAVLADAGALSGVREVTFVRHEESVQRGFARVSRNIAETVVSDLLVR